MCQPPGWTTFHARRPLTHVTGIKKKGRVDVRWKETTFSPVLRNSYSPCNQTPHLPCHACIGLMLSSFSNRDPALSQLPGLLSQHTRIASLVRPRHVHVIHEEHAGLAVANGSDFHTTEVTGGIRESDWSHGTIAEARAWWEGIILGKCWSLFIGDWVPVQSGDLHGTVSGASIVAAKECAECIKPEGRDIVGSRAVNLPRITRLTASSYACTVREECGDIWLRYRGKRLNTLRSVDETIRERHVVIWTQI